MKNDKDMLLEKQLSYNPSLTYQDEYTSDYNQPIKEDSIPIEDKDDEIQDLVDKGDGLENMVDKLPGELSDIVSDILDQINDFVHNELEGERLERVPVESEWEFDIDKEFKPGPGDGEDDDKTTDEDAFWDDDDYVKVDKEFHTKKEIFEKEFIKNLYDLFEDYYTNLHTVLANYWSNLLISTYDKENSEIKLILDNIVLSKDDVLGEMLHLLDSAIRTEVIGHAQIKYFKNIFNAQETIKHLNQLKAVQDLRVRYASIDAVKPKNNQEKMSNSILEGMLLTYDKKYDIAYENLYRYLHSSNVILKDTFGVLIQEIKSKQTLVERKGIK